MVYRLKLIKLFSLAVLQKMNCKELWADNTAKTKVFKISLVVAVVKKKSFYEMMNNTEEKAKIAVVWSKVEVKDLVNLVI